MAKATADNVKAEGWRESQFGAGFASPAAFDVYLTELVDEAGRWTEHALGAALYAATVSPAYAFDCLKRAELCFVAMRLWKRRASFLDSQGNTGLDQSAYLERREYLAHADRAWECAKAALSDALTVLGVDPSVLPDVPAFAFGYIETGEFPRTSAEALNA